MKRSSFLKSLLLIAVAPKVVMEATTNVVPPTTALPVINILIGDTVCVTYLPSLVVGDIIVDSLFNQFRVSHSSKEEGTKLEVISNNPSKKIITKINPYKEYRKICSTYQEKI